MSELNNNQPLDKTKFKKVKRSVKRMPPQTPQVGAGQTENLAFAQGNGLKKVKRPIRKMQPLMPQTDTSRATSNPFEQNLSNSGTNVDAFNAENILNVNNLPSTNNVAQGPQQDPHNPQFISDEQDIDYGNDYYQVETSNSHKKMIMVAAFAAFVVGFFVSRLFFSEQKITRNGLQGVVVNAEVPQGRARCGVAEGGQGCVLYLMNPQRQELNARDFYDLAAQLTGRQRFVIETGNMRYSNVKIRPGEIGQFNIPPLTQ